MEVALNYYEMNIEDNQRYIYELLKQVKVDDDMNVLNVEIDWDRNDWELFEGDFSSLLYEIAEYHKNVRIIEGK